MHYFFLKRSCIWLSTGIWKNKLPSHYQRAYQIIASLTSAIKVTCVFRLPPSIFRRPFGFFLQIIIVMAMLVFNVLRYIGYSLSGRGYPLSMTSLKISVFPNTMLKLTTNIIYFCLLKGLFDARPNKSLSIIRIAEAIIKIRIFPDCWKWIWIDQKMPLLNSNFIGTNMLPALWWLYSVCNGDCFYSILLNLKGGRWLDINIYINALEAYRGQITQYQVS